MGKIDPKQKLTKVTKRKPKPADEAGSSLERGICPVCEIDVALVKDGTIRTHHVRTEGGKLVAANAFSGRECKGIGEKPKASNVVAKSDTVVADAPKGPKQPHLPAPGMAPTVHKDVNEAAEALGDAKERLKSAQNVKKMKEDALIFVMKKRGLTHYVDRGLNIEIILESPDRVKLKSYNHEDENDE